MIAGKQPDSSAVDWPPPADRPRWFVNFRGQTALARYGLAVLAVVSATLFTEPITWLTRYPTLSLYYLAVLVAAWYGGPRAGLLAVGLSALVGAYFFEAPPFSLAIGQAGIMHVVVFVLVALVVNVMVTRHQQALQAETRLLEERQHQGDLLGQAYALLDTLFTSAPVGLAFLDREMRFVRVNETLARTNRQPVAAHQGKTLEELLGPVPQVVPLREAWQRVLATGQPMLDFEFSSRRLGQPGQLAYWQVDWYPIRHGGEVLGVGAVVQDITERRRTEKAQRLLAEAGSLLADSLDFEATLAAVTQVVVPALADLCVVDLVAADGTIQRAGVTHSDPERTRAIAEFLHRYPPSWTITDGVVGVLRSGQALLHPELPADLVKRIARDEEHLRQLQALHLVSAMVVPLVARGQTLGAVTFAWSESDYRYDAADLALAEELAGRMAQALERARLYREAQEEIASRQRAEAQLTASLQEKEVLLREVHHRVKNNLQAISNLLYLQTAHLPDESLRQMFRETQNRVKSIALIHQKLYQSKELARLDFGEYIRNLADHLLHSYLVHPESVTVNVVIEPVEVDVDTAVSLGIIINELVSNALEHAFPPDHPTNGQGRTIDIKLQAAEGPDLLLTVRDNGVGLPAGVEVGRTPSLGLQLVGMLTDHMRSTVETERAGGTTFKIRFNPGPPRVEEEAG